MKNLTYHIIACKRTTWTLHKNKAGEYDNMVRHGNKRVLKYKVYVYDT